MSILQLRRYQKRDADLDAVAASGVASAWTAYTPTVTAGSGAFTTVSATGRYLAIGKLTFVSITVTITTNGTAATSVVATLPNTAAAASVLSGRDAGAGAKMLSAYVAAAGNSVAVRNYDNTYPGASGSVLVVSGSYENT